MLGPARAPELATGYGQAFATIAVVLAAVALLAAALPRRRDASQVPPRQSGGTGDLSADRAVPSADQRG
ncbi:hypothetical protein ACFSTC_38090 [Nonomuraea ferruginea]